MTWFGRLLLQFPQGSGGGGPGFAAAQVVAVTRVTRALGKASATAGARPRTGMRVSASCVRE
ncbi:hypothetical protein [Saccharopolyspora spinosa]|uniref:hypothetical protein n=1 Tax=Saccharopolyspora spinosa TaxID=60894 RepID=UPI000237B41A